MNTTNFRKMYTPEEIKAIAGGGGAGLEVIEITDVSATSGTLNEVQMAIVNSNTPSCVKFNNEYYYKNDDNHTDGITVYTHTGYTEADGGATIKYFNITLATSAWTLTTTNLPGKLYVHTVRFAETSQNPYYFLVDFILPTPTPLANIYSYMNEYYERNGKKAYSKSIQVANKSDEHLPTDKLLLSAYLNKDSSYESITAIVATINTDGISGVSTFLFTPATTPYTFSVRVFEL